MRRPSSLLGSLVNNFCQGFDTVNRENLKSLEAFGGLCFEAGQLPTSAALRKGILLPDEVYTHGRFTVVWKASLDESLVAIKVPFFNLSKDRSEATKVSKQPTCGVHLQTNFTETVETDTGVEETVPSKHCTIPRHQRNSVQ